jgi:hypothetical protein
MKKENEQIIKSVLWTDLYKLTMGAPNKFPDYLPGDLGQYLIWVERYETDLPEISEFTARSMKFLGLGVDDVLMFERSRAARQEIVRGTFPGCRHIHF